MSVHFIGRNWKILVLKIVTVCTCKCAITNSQMLNFKHDQLSCSSYWLAHSACRQVKSHDWSTCRCWFYTIIHQPNGPLEWFEFACPVCINHRQDAEPAGVGHKQTTIVYTVRPWGVYTDHIWHCRADNALPGKDKSQATVAVPGFNS